LERAILKNRSFFVFSGGLVISGRITRAKAIFHKYLGRSLFQLLLGALSLSFAAPQASALLGPEYQMQLGNPSSAITDTNNHNHYLIVRPVEALDYSDNLGEPNWASWDLTPPTDVGGSGRANFISDPTLPSNFTPVSSASFSGYDRGHMCPSGDRTISVPTNQLVFYMSNIIPQASAQNQGVWADLEDYCRSTAGTVNELLITCGPQGFAGTTTSNGRVAVPTNTWKIVVVVPVGTNLAPNRINYSTRVIAVEIPNTTAAGSINWTNFITSAKQVEIDTGFTFFTALPTNLAWVLRSKVDGKPAAAPGSLGFFPSTSPTGTSITLTGTNLDSTTNVTFNGIAATYTIISPTEINATVPAGATVGPVTVNTLGGNATSASSFTPTAPTSLQSLQTVFVILLENENWASISGNAAAPYINHGLLPMASHAEQYFNPPGIHPSLPNYLWLEAGTNFGVTADGDPSSYHQGTTNHLVTLLKNAGISWTSFQEDITGTTCPLTSTNQYAPKHNPMVYFDDVTNTNNTGSTYCISNVRPYTELATDLASNVVTRYNFITPNLCDDMHGNTGCPAGSLITQGDTWLSNNIPVIMNSQAYSNNGVIFITWDEGEGGDGPIGMIVLSSLAKGGGYSNAVHYTHSSTLRTIEEIFNVGPLLGDAANATDISDFFAFGAPSQLTVSPSSGLASSGLVGGSFSPVSQTYTLSNAGGATLSWTANNSATWLSLSATSGTLAPGSNAAVTATINANANSLAANSYADTISFTNLTGGIGDTARSVTLTINAPTPVIVASPSTLVSESCLPTNGVIDPGESVTINFSLRNIGTGNTSNLVVTLVATNGVTSPSGPQTYGAVIAGGAAVTEPFTFTASGVCGGSVAATLQLQDGLNSLESITYVLPLGQPLSPLTQDFDEVTAPALPAGWSTSASGAQSNWVTSTTQSDTSPNAAFSPDPGIIGVNELDTPSIPIVSSSAILTFVHNYSLAADASNPSVGLDGGVLEIKMGGGSYTDIVAAGGSMVSGGYNATIISTNGNLLAGRQAWSGNSGDFITTVVNVPAAAAGQNVQFRWLCGAGSVPTNALAYSGAMAVWGFDASTPTADTVATNVVASSVTLANETGSLTYFGGNPSSGKAIASSGFTSSAGPPTTSYSYFAFSLTVTNGYRLGLTSLSFDDQASNTGVHTYDVQISQSPTFASVIYDSGAKTAHLSSFGSNSLALTSSNLTGTVYFRIYGYGATGGGGTWRIDNLNVQGSVAGSSVSTGTGWYIDSITVQDFACCVNTNAPPADPFTTWQNQYFTSGELLDPAFSGPAADPFGKGISNTNQFLAGFDPTNAAAYLHITRISGTNGGTDVRVDYLGASGDSSYSGGPASRTNVLEFTAGAVDGSYNSNNFASANVTNVLSGGIGLGTMTNMVDPGGATNTPSRYYRVRVLVP
jgi:DNA/RNA endonuclease G (NUC1)